MGKLSVALETIKEDKKTNLNLQPDRDRTVWIHYSKIYPDPYQYSHLGKTPEEYEQEVRELMDEIEAVGKVLEPVLLRKIGADEFYVMGGRHRRDACQLLVEEKGKDKYKFVPAIVLNVTEAQAEFITLGSNSRWEKKDWHIMHEITRKKYLIENFPEDFPFIQDKGRMIEKLAVAMKMPKSTVGEYLQISNNLSEKAMEAFEKQQLNKSAAVAMSSLTHEEQDTLLDEGVTKQKDIKAYKEEKTEQIVHRTTVTDSVKNTIVHKVEDDTNTLSDSTSGVIDVLPGQYRVTNTDMDIEEVDVIEEKTLSEAVETNCKCSSCQKFTPFNYIFKFKNKHYCFNCLYNLIIDLAKNGVITIDHSNVDTEGMIIHLQTEHSFS